MWPTIENENMYRENSISVLLKIGLHFSSKALHYNTLQLLEMLKSHLTLLVDRL